MIERLKHQALLNCMAGQGRYMDCLGRLIKSALGGEWGVEREIMTMRSELLKSEFAELKEILLEFEEYDAKMREAGMR